MSMVRKNKASRLSWKPVRTGRLQSGMTLMEVMVVVAIIAVVSAIASTSVMDRCKPVLSSKSRAFTMDMLAARSSARANNWTVNMWLGFNCYSHELKEDRFAYARHVDMNGDLVVDPGEPCETVTLTDFGCSGVRSVAFGLVSGSGPVDLVTHATEADGITSPDNVITIGPGGVTTPLNANTDTVYLSILRNNGTVVDQTDSAARAIVIRPNGRTITYGWLDSKWELWRNGF